MNDTKAVLIDLRSINIPRCGRTIYFRRRFIGSPTIHWISHLHQKIAIVNKLKKLSARIYLYSLNGKRTKGIIDIQIIGLVKR
jgi:hypothetical protein